MELQIIKQRGKSVSHKTSLTGFLRWPVVGRRKAYRKGNVEEDTKGK